MYVTKLHRTLYAQNLVPYQSPQKLGSDRGTSLPKKRQRADFPELPVSVALQRAVEANSPMGKYYMQLMDTAPGANVALGNIRNRVKAVTTIRMMTYTSINPDLSVHPVYDSVVIPEISRISFTRMRLSSHYLHIETGRWSRLPRERRTCICGAIQTEHHVLLHCPETERLRRYSLQYADMNSLMNSNTLDLIQYCHAVLQRMNNNY